MTCAGGETRSGHGPEHGRGGHSRVGCGQVASVYGHQLGRSNYSAAELDYMLEDITDIHPISDVELVMVADNHLSFLQSWSAPAINLRRISTSCQSLLW